MSRFQVSYSEKVAVIVGFGDFDFNVSLALGNCIREQLPIFVNCARSLFADLFGLLHADSAVYNIVSGCCKV